MKLSGDVRADHEAFLVGNKNLHRLISSYWKRLFLDTLGRAILACASGLIGA
jgi:hypothetical protein